jgi:hypothetical protein
MRPVTLYRDGDLVAVFDDRSQRWVSARVVAAKLGRLIVATAKWHGVVPTSPRAVRPIHVVGA